MEVSKVSPRVKKIDESSRLRIKFRDQLSPHFERTSLFSGMLILGLHLSAMILTAVFCQWILKAASGNIIYTVFALLFVCIGIVFIGSRLRALGNIVHECSHLTFTRSAVFDKVCGHLLCLILFSSFSRYMSEHASHHRHLGDFEKDKDLKNLLGLGITEQTPVTTHIKRAVTLAHLPWYLTVTLDAPEDPLVVRMCRWLYLGALVSFAITGDFAPLFLYYLLPFMTSYQVFRYLSDAMDHAGIVTQKEEFLRSRNHIFKNKLWNMLVFPRNDAYHLIHHLFPRLPTRSFPKAHALLLKDTAYAARNHSINKDEASALP